MESKSKNIFQTTFSGFYQMLMDIIEHFSKMKSKYKILLGAFIFFMSSAIAPLYLLIIGEKDIYNAGYISNDRYVGPSFVNYVSHLRFCGAILLFALIHFIYVQYKDENDIEEKMNEGNRTGE